VADAVPIMGYDLGMPTARAISATAIPNGFALGVVFEPSSYLAGVRLDAALVPNVATPFTTSPLTYIETTIAWDGTHVLGALLQPDHSSYLKTYPLDMSAYITADYIAAAAADPTFASAGSTWFGAVFTNMAFQLYPLAVDGQPEASPFVFDASSTITSGSVASTGPALVAVWSNSDGSCEVGASDGVTGTTAVLAASCTTPRVSSGVGRATVIYERSGQIYERGVTVSSDLSIALGAEATLVRGTSPRMVVGGGDRWLVYADTTLQLARLDGNGTVAFPIVGLPANPPDAWTVTATQTTDYIFATVGSTVWAVAICP
jgi:hypothetical protein